MKIEIGVTHEIQINGDKSWVKLGIIDDVDPMGSLDESIDALSEKVNQKIMDVIQKTVDTVNEFEEKK